MQPLVENLTFPVPEKGSIRGGTDGLRSVRRHRKTIDTPSNEGVTRLKARSFSDTMNPERLAAHERAAFVGDKERIQWPIVSRRRDWTRW